MRYQKIESFIWNDEKFVKLNPLQQRFFFYVMTCPHNNLIGLYVLKPGYACEDLKCTVKSFNINTEKLNKVDLVEYDWQTGVCWIKNFLKHNPLTNPNQKKSAISILRQLPKSFLIKRFLEKNQLLKQGLTEGLTEGLTKPRTEAGTEAEAETETKPSSPSGEFLLSKSVEFQTIWQEYLLMRQKVRKPATEKAKQLILSKLAKLSTDEKTQIKILEQSIENSWQGVFELKTEGGKNKNVSDHHPHGEKDKYSKYC